MQLAEVRVLYHPSLKLNEVFRLPCCCGKHGLYFRYFPFHLSFHRIAAEEISGFQPCTYNPIRDYGGWGIRFGRKGKAYNVSGDRGVQIELAKEKHLLIVSQRPEELVEALTSILAGTR
jgi:hypothetical protein